MISARGPGPSDVQQHHDPHLGPIHTWRVGDGFVDVHDLVHFRTPEGRKQSVSSYRKRRLDRIAVAADLVAEGLDLVRNDVERGLVTILARRNSGPSIGNGPRTG